ncbi:MAG TPA: 4-hydroxy-tetrahydrodipicolinate reductase [Oligoflexus sp.]|uniref:4-hydroxy-tetrahydrodipicolinate reductase n=1 Tax=Oligoflexus sp. TaxID=1971216 RepID=UPI002D2D5DDF|nr:4-hydroxy-tetrahydrodipicolinate reductase [Oligoflexus sp.]HYX38311.1 4-hydroxy-tetrahydrodipicolinate reductase [Oligoflexus sp.]
MSIQRVWINGLSGKMGLELQTLIASSERWDLVGGTSIGELVDRESGVADTDWKRLPECLNRTDVLIDFSAPAGNASLLKFFQDSSVRDKAVLIGTTGLDRDQRQEWKRLATERGLRLLLAPNTSLGVLLTLKVSQQLAGVLDNFNFDIEVVESHHRAKIDAPSGTAKFLAEGVAKVLDKKTIYGRTGQRQPQEVGVASLRGGSVFGEHEIRFLGDHEELVVSHRALSRTLFAQGALLLAGWIISRSPGAYGLEDVSIEDMLKLLQTKGA